jgi:alanine racemase
VAAPLGAKTWIEISASALRNNINALRGTLDPGVRFCAVVKANAYGHGTREVVSIALEEGVDMFAVDCVDEALIVRSLAPVATIFVMGMTVPERLKDIIEARVIQTVYDSYGVRALKDAAKEAGKPALMTLELETGLHRLGAEGRGLVEILELLKASAGYIYLVSVASHLSSAEDASRKSVTAQQYEQFAVACREIFHKGFQPEHYHIACSAAGIMHELPHGTCIRFGIMMYGLWPSSDARREGTLGKRHADLKPVLAFKTRVAQVKDVTPGGGIGYGPAVVLNRTTRVAVLPVGYYDGFDRGFSLNGSVAIHGTRCQILGRICMNMFMVDASTVPGTLTPETVVTLLGRDGMHTITADDWAEKLGTINYETVTRLNPLLPRVIV